jgi:REP element-mobilizing transposase RayT
MPNKPSRWKDNNSIYFLTFCTFKRRQILHNKKVTKIILLDLEYYKYILKEIIAYTIMPEHIHMIVSINNSQDLSLFLQRFKSHSAKEVKRITGIKDHVWQLGTMDHCIRDDKDFDNHIKYLFYNSMKHLKISPKQFELHNFHDMIQKEWLEEDFCDFCKEIKKYEIYE